MKETTQPPKDPKKKLWIGYAVILAIVILSNVFLFPALMQASVKSVNYSTFLQMLESKELATVQIEDQQIYFVDKNDNSYKTNAIMQDNNLVTRLEDAGVEFGTVYQSPTIWDSLLNLLVDSLLTDTAAMAIPADSIDSLTAPRDSIYRLLKGFRNVKIYRSDFQTVCDSMTAISTDSTIHLYIDPVLWNENNQITSDVMDIFTENQQLTRAEFIGSPMMVSQLDTTHYNQVAGKTMTAYFFNNQIYRNDVNGNAQTIYYMQDGEPVEITMMGVIESGEISFFIEDKQVVQITYRGDPVYNFYPMDKIPPTQDIRLKGFKWEGARRPSQAEVFDRRIRPSERERRSEMKHPDFPIMQRIDEHRKRLIEQRRWTDRNDQVDAATVEWMHSLGYEVGQPRKTEAPAE